ncbi:phenylalanine--tRNA ligase subunit alpha [Candidatus Uhrbacteria bacterium RIFCSPHIGHO2_02_FULL_53_13]|uniref:Phenylalanine--tRNA ligase alpha subunit n=1 Tax=Candidatus Uhrbacteria bacterium RIFCSPHIGHO2_02_FULL_53_13 TaxID=1802389 RepID=A0A1F7TVT5_9BACT|nr:MAG: phenylalanine--tRNA ligase subunit alpha [Candidatus Uhrbacteria bacterium RIFCSPHIGHO2_02_FULL_53_13]
MSIDTQLKQFKDAFNAELANVSNAETLEVVRVKYLGRKSAFQDILRNLKDMNDEERREAGQAANAVKEAMQAAIESKEAELERCRYDHLATDERVDISLPGFAWPKGHLHMTTRAIRDIQRIFERLGFTRVRYPEVEWEHYAFDVLRMGTNHPARDNWETYFIDAPVHEKFGRMILTPHTTNGDVREMERGELPIRTMNINKTYRRQSDVSHVPMFHQFEGLLVDRDVSVTHLKGLFEHFAKEFFGPDREIRLRPHHFRFTEPSFEIDVSCGLCAGEGCRMCKQGWLELGGAGMLHPDVLRAGGVDPDEYTALAFGWGVERTASMRSGINIADIRVMYKNDIRFLEQF